MSGDRVFIVVPGLGTLALEVDVYHRALTEGAALVGAPMATVAAQEPSLDAEQLASVLSLPVTWINKAALEKRIPSIQAGRWRRFRRSAVEAALAANPRDPKTAKGAMPGTARPFQSQQHHQESTREDTARIKHRATSYS